MKNILVASDLSDRSRQAVRRGVELSARTGARLTVLHVVDAAMPEPLSGSVKTDATRLLAQEVAEDAGTRSIAHEIKVVIGDTVEEIHQIAEEIEADLLIVGLHRRRVFLDHIKETTMEHLIRASARPVLLVARDVTGPYSRVLGGVDLSSVCASGLHKIEMVAPGAELTLFHAHEVSFREEAERDYETWQAVSELPDGLPDPVFVEAKARDALTDIMAEDDYDLLVIGAYTRSNAGRYILGGFSSGLIRQPPCDLLLAK
ncbi:universal stress protein [Roseobacter sinensis]|uniref:Universal stress protein n=1 Tax=Roseobacter sinensis TaxID=2931391 RepID=A0ABT3BGV6_9RHOB|nr:universal stress protein [Roseobacter sp. WL0113]MCV3272812.1 universal stress protein [Roseobacter sp. WL0113]